MRSAMKTPSLLGTPLKYLWKRISFTRQKLQTDSVWLVGQLPYEVRQTLNLPNDAKGIDGVFQTRTARRPGTAEDNGAAFIVKDASGQALSYVYYELEPGRRGSLAMLAAMRRAFL